MKIKVISVLLLLLSGIVLAVYASASDVKVTINGEELTFDRDQAPIIEKKRTLVPMEPILEALGAQVDRNPETQTVTAVKDGIVITMTVGSDVMYKNNEEVKLDVPAKIVGDSTLIPVRAVAECFGAEVHWEARSRTVKIEHDFSRSGGSCRD